MKEGAPPRGCFSACSYVGIRLVLFRLHLCITMWAVSQCCFDSKNDDVVAVGRAGRSDAAARRRGHGGNGAPGSQSSCVNHDELANIEIVDAIKLHE